MSDLIDRQAAIDAIMSVKRTDNIKSVAMLIMDLPSTQPTLYGYKIEHLALIARVMEKEGVTPEKAVQTFEDMKRIIEILIEEIQENVERAMMGVEHESD